MLAIVVKAPGLKRRTGSWTVCKGVFRPVIFIDPQTPTTQEANFMVQHEVAHAEGRHALFGILLLFSVIGVPFYLHYRRWCEILADRSATRVFGKTTMMIYCRMRKHPTSRWGRFLYGNSAEDRIKRTLKGQEF